MILILVIEGFDNPLFFRFIDVSFIGIWLNFGVYRNPP